tara:strand:- start:279 stop:464 length:186 start_codon:yes stop_codon:yes gene_type:complete
MKRSRKVGFHLEGELGLERMVLSREQAVVMKSEREEKPEGTWLNAERLIKVGNSDLSDGKA